jgi:hypothetical protein
LVSRTLRTAALIAVPIGAVGAVALFFRAADHPPAVLVILFILWLLSPFALLGWALARSTRWAVPTQTALYGVTLVITLGTLALYGNVIVVAPAGAPKAAVFVVTAPASWLLMAVVVPLAALISRGR